VKFEHTAGAFAAIETVTARRAIFVFAILTTYLWRSAAVTFAAFDAFAIYRAFVFGANITAYVERAITQVKFKFALVTNWFRTIAWVKLTFFTRALTRINFTFDARTLARVNAAIFAWVGRFISIFVNNYFSVFAIAVAFKRVKCLNEHRILSDYAENHY
jgi:hypothetical protein